MAESYPALEPKAGLVSATDGNCCIKFCIKLSTG